MLVSPWRRLVDSRAAPVGLIALFLVLILLTIQRFSVWIDESATLELVGPNGYGEILSRVRFDAHPPLWYLALKPWLQVFGTHVVVSRAQSAVYMVAAFVVWYRFVSSRFSRPLALLTLALMVTNPMLLHYGVEGRMYAFGIFLTAVSTTLVTSTSRYRWYAYWLCAVAMLYTHYFLAFPLAAQFVYLLVSRREQRVKPLWLLIYGTSIVATFVPWLPYALHFTGGVVAGGYWIAPITPNVLPAYILNAFLHRLDRELDGFRVLPALAYLAVWFLCLIRAARANTGPRALMWCLAVIPSVILCALSCKPLQPIFHARYVIFGLPALITLMAVGALALGGRMRVVAISVLIAGQLTGIQMLRYRGFTDDRGFYTMKTIAREVNTPIDGEMPLVVASSEFAFFDAFATLGDSQRVVHYRSDRPGRERMPDVLYYDRPDWYVLSLDDIHARNVWMLEDAGKPPLDVPQTWKQITTHNRGYVRTRLFSVQRP